MIFSVTFPRQPGGLRGGLRSQRALLLCPRRGMYPFILDLLWQELKLKTKIRPISASFALRLRESNARKSSKRKHLEMSLLVLKERALTKHQAYDCL